MSYIWEISDTRHKFAVSPHCLGSASEASVTTAESGKFSVIVNPFLRFSDIFSDEVFHENSIDPELVNVLFHYLAHSDRLYGDTVANARLTCIEEEICGGLYGESVKNDYLILSALHKRMITQFLSYCHKNSERPDLFGEVFLAFFGRLEQTVSGDENYRANYSKHSAEIIFSRSRSVYYCYCATEESEYNSALFRLVRDLFSDCTIKIVPVWGRYNFGIVGDSDTTHSTVPIVGQMQLI